MVFAMEKIKTELEIAESKKANLRKTLDQIHSSSSSFLLLSIQWKDLEDHFETTRRFLQERVQDLESKEKETGALHESLKRRVVEVENREKRIEEFSRGLEVRENQYGERVRALEVKEERLREGLVDFELKLSEIKEILDEFDSKEKWFGKRVRELDEKEERLGEKKKRYRECLMEIEEMYEEIEERSKDVKLREERMEAKENEYGERMRELKVKEDRLKEKWDELEEWHEVVEVRDKTIKEISKGFVLKEKEIEERLKELESKEIEFERRVTAAASLTPMQQHSGSKRPLIAVSVDAAQNASKKANCTVHSHVKSEKLSKESSPLDSRVASSTVNPQQDSNCLSVNVDGEKLRSFLNKQVEYESIRSEVSDALQSVPDPYKLVLDAMNGDKGFKLGVSRNFILLLKQLTGLSPQIKPVVKVEAMQFAHYWKSTLEKKRDDHLHVVAFLHFLAAYGLGSFFNVDEVLGLLDTDVWRKLVPDLGLTDIMPSFIQNLIKKEKQLEAIKYICALELVANFPPVPLLKDHLMNSNRKVENLCKKGNNSLSVQLEGIGKELAALRDVLSCISIYKLEDEYLPEILEKNIAELEKQQAKKKREYDESNVKRGALTTSKVTLLKQHRQQQTSLSPKSLESARDPQQTEQGRPQYTEQKCIAPTTMITTTSPLSAQTSVNTPKSEPEEHSGSEHLSPEVPKEVPPIYSIRDTSAFHSMQPPNWQPPGLFMNRGAPYLNTSARHYSLSGQPHAGLHMNSYIIPYPNALRNPVYYNRPPSLGSPGDAIRGPGFYNGTMPYRGNNLPP